MKRFSLLFLAGLLACAGLGAAPATLPFVSPIVGEHMVLQRGQTNRVWGWTTPGAEVRVAIGGVTASAVAAADGRWQAEFAPPSAGGPYTLTIDGPQHLEFSDVLVGDVWLCSGQSNMEFGLARARDGAAETAAANQPGIRLFRVATKSAYAAVAVPQGEWRACVPENAGGFSAVAYFFARKVHAETGVPIGLIQAAVGGTFAECWMSPEALAPLPEFRPAFAEIARLHARGGEQYGNYVSHWYDEFDRGQREGWGDESLDTAGWKATSLKTAFADLGVPAAPAVVWLRREITLPEPLPAGAAKCLLGVVEKMDTVFLNGRWVGASSWVENPRAYPIPAGVLRPGRNVVAIRVLKTKPDGGFTNPAADLKLVLGDGTAIPLEGAWRGAVSVDARAPHPLPLAYENYPTMPSVLFNGMIRPLAPLALTGALWYQGEANQFNAPQYRTLLPALIADWRALFAHKTLPFYIASLPAFTGRKELPPAQADGWTQIREIQLEIGRTVPHAGCAVTVDTGDANDIHPTEKASVGERLALLALREVYGREVVSAGPTFAVLEPLPGALRIRFTGTDGGLVARGEKLGEFAIAGADRVWRWAEARIEGDTIVVSSPAVPKPVAVRYAWQANPLATLFNGAGLPAAPFRSDNW
ncbi:MAG TPA: sialate O-acetylesterase [Opitutaceae bacterium]|nr:sialate O-acetylesterase [Opitutaceae bacterium]